MKASNKKKQHFREFKGELIRGRFINFMCSVRDFIITRAARK